MSRLRQGPGNDDRIYALGQVAERAAVMEIALRTAFCVLVDGRYGAIVAGSLEAHTLIENCDAIARQHASLQPVQQDAIRAGLRACGRRTRNAYCASQHTA